MTEPFWHSEFGRHDERGMLLPPVPDAYECSFSSYWNIGVMPRPRGLRRLWLRLQIWWVNFTDQWEPLTDEPEPIDEEEMPEPDEELEPDLRVTLSAMCVMCGYRWLATFFRGTPRLECRQCGFLTEAPKIAEPVSFPKEYLDE